MTAPATTFVVPDTEPKGDDGWEIYVEPLRLEKGASDPLSPGTANPEAAVVHFYASLMRGDDAWKDATPELASDERLAAKMDRLSSWTIEAVELRGRRLRGTARASIKLWMKLTVDGKTDDGEDEVELRKQDDGRWLVTRPPT